MDRAKILFAWIVKRSFPISIVFFVLIYIWWFRLTPWNAQEECCSSRHYQFGLTLLVFYIGSGTLWWLARNRTCLGVFFRLTAIFFFLLNSCYITIFMPRIIDAAKYNRTMYYLVSYSNWPEHNPWDYYQLTKWQGILHYEIVDQPDEWVWRGKLLFDQKNKLVNIVAIDSLLYTDATPPRYYDHDSEQLGSHLYYVSSQCVHCNTGPYTMYECDLDNTSCTMLPFRYTGTGEFAYLDFDEKNKEINFIAWLASKGKFVAYSYGEHPRCYVEGCEILKNTK